MKNGYEDNATYQTFISKNLSEEVAVALMKMFEDLNLTIEEFDERAVELLTTFTPDQGKFIIKELLVRQ